MARRSDWVCHFSASEIEEIQNATATLANISGDLAATGRDHFPLPRAGPRLHGWLDEVLNGRGFVLIRGLPVERWTERETALAFLGIGHHLGNLRPQNAAGHLLGHVTDLGRSSLDPNARIYQTRERQTHHTDSCDVVALLCLRPARSGGLSSLVSSMTIFNEIRCRRPDLLIYCLSPSRRTVEAKCKWEASPTLESPSSTGMQVWFRRFIRGNISSRQGGLPMFSL
ncbi:MAG TPA: TauD/TfdA family dioxygenase [Blastocatellia bacterium]|nr:TauD/TfdA family dioxygenase [Blastocatellia bacterium]